MARTRSVKLELSVSKQFKSNCSEHLIRRRAGGGLCVRLSQWSPMNSVLGLSVMA